MNPLDQLPDVQQLDQLLAEADFRASRGEAVDPTVNLLRGELETMADDLRQPIAPDPFQGERACATAIEMACCIGTESSRNALAITPANPTEEELGQIGPYQLLELLGQGGMGAVYKALHPKLDKIVALKVLTAGRLKSGDAINRFEREMKAVGKLDHPHLIRALDAGEADRSHYLVMEYVSGIDLAALLKQHGPLPVAEACELVLQAASGLQAAHSRGMVHRDIKPANLMLARQEFGPPVVKVLDLGLALLADADPVEAGGLTSDGQIMGTIDYMAPEQAHDSHSVDIRADIYSLGATLYALLTGGSLFQCKPHLSLMQKLTALATEPVPPIRERRPDISEALARVIHRMLAKQPRERFATMAEVIASLKPFAARAELVSLCSGKVNPTSSGSCQVDSYDGTVLLVSAQQAQPTVSLEVASRRERKAPRKPLTFIAGVVLATALFAFVLLTLKTPNGEVIVSIPDDLPAEVRKEIKISVTGDGAAEVASEANDWKVGIKEGKYSVELTGGKDRVQVEDKEVTVSRGKQAIVTITTKPLGEMVGKKDDGKSANPDRQFAEWLKSLPAVTFDVALADGNWQRIGPEQSLPENLLAVQHVFLQGPALDQPQAFAEEFAKRVKGTTLNGLQLGSPKLTTEQVGQYLRLPELANLKTVGLSSDELDDGVIEHLARLKNLQFLDTRCPKLTGKGLRQLRDLKSLAMHDIADMKPEAFEEIGQLTKLVYLQGGFRYTERHVETIAKLKLESLLTQGAGITDDMLTRLIRMETLQHLALNKSPITDAGLPALKKLKNLTALHLTETKVTAAGVADLQQALPNCNIVSDISTANPNRQFAEWLKSFDPPIPFEVTLADGNIQPVRVQDPLPTASFRVHLVYLIGPQSDQRFDAFLDEFTKRVKGQHLTGVFLKSSTLTSEAVARLTQLPEFSELNILGITSPLVDDSVFKSLAAIPNLQYVDLTCPRLTGQGLGTLRRMKNLAMLKGVNLSVEGFAELQHVPLEYLQIDGINFTEPYVATLMKFKLTALYTNDVGIDDAILARIAKMTTLDHLDLNRNPVTDAGLSELKKLKRLRVLKLSGTKVTTAGVADLQQALPTCKIEWDAPKE